MTWIKRAANENAVHCAQNGHVWVHPREYSRGYYMQFDTAPPQFNFKCSTCDAIVCTSAEGIRAAEKLDCGAVN